VEASLCLRSARGYKRKTNLRVVPALTASVREKLPTCPPQVTQTCGRYGERRRQSVKITRESNCSRLPWKQVHRHAYTLP